MIDLTCSFLVVTSGKPWARSKRIWWPNTDSVPVRVRSRFSTPLARIRSIRSRYWRMGLRGARKAIPIYAASRASQRITPASRFAKRAFSPIYSGCGLDKDLVAPAADHRQHRERQQEHRERDKRGRDRPGDEGRRMPGGDQHGAPQVLLKHRPEQEAEQHRRRLEVVLDQPVADHAE